MTNMYAGSEIVELGIQIEKNGRDFYNGLVEQSKDENSRGMFKTLAGQEEEHITTFQHILSLFNKYEPAESYPDEYFAYMNALAGDHVFTRENKGEEIARKVKNDREAIDIALRFEKDSIIFYEGMKKLISANDQGIVDSLIAEEQKHICDLISLKKNLPL